MQVMVINYHARTSVKKKLNPWELNAIRCGKKIESNADFMSEIPVLSMKKGQVNLT